MNEEPNLVAKSYITRLSILAIFLIIVTKSLPETIYKRNGLFELPVSPDFMSSEWEGLVKGLVHGGCGGS